MSEPKRTPGPWRVHIESAHVPRVSIVGGDDVLICEMNQVTRPKMFAPENVVADADLMSSAPDLYEGAVAILDLYERSNFSGKELTAAILRLQLAVAKAKGET